MEGYVGCAKIDVKITQVYPDSSLSATLPNTPTGQHDPWAALSSRSEFLAAQPATSTPSSNILDQLNQILNGANTASNSAAAQNAPQLSPLDKFRAWQAQQTAYTAVQTAAREAQEQWRAQGAGTASQPGLQPSFASLPPYGSIFTAPLATHQNLKTDATAATIQNGRTAVADILTVSKSTWNCVLSKQN
jgi:hypothetical protein